MNPVQLTALEQAAQSWLGTPFRANSRTRGPAGGVCCHFLVVELYARVGLKLAGAPKGPPGHARFQRESIMEPWIDTCPLFERVVDHSSARPGDLMGFRIGSAIHHLAILLSGGCMVHAVDFIGVCINPVDDPTWSKRFAAAWRPSFPT